MSINRLSSGLLTTQSVNFLNNNLSILSRMQEKISSGKNINRPSDDPVGLTRILDLAKTLKTDERFMRNVEQALAEVTTSETAMGSITNLIHRARELATQGANFSNNQDGMNAIALEIDEIINQMVQLGNTSISGKYIFGGMRTDIEPFSRVGDDITYAGTPPAENFGRPVEISRGVQVNVNINGETLLGQDQVATVVPPTFVPGSNGLFQTLVELKLNLQQGDTANVRLRLDDLAVDLNNVLAQQATLGSIRNRLDLTLQRLEEKASILTRQFGAIQDVDLPKAISELNFQESIFNASLGVTARVLQTSILDFLR